MLDNWIWSETILMRISQHFQTKERINKELVEAKIKSRSLNEATFSLKQVFYGTFDFMIYSIEHPGLDEYDEKKVEGKFSIAKIRKEMTKNAEGNIDISELWHKLVKEITLIEP